MLSRLLIANRGEIACRVARTARAMGIHTIGVYSDADASGSFREHFDETVRLGGPRAQDSYLRGDLILDVARRCGAQAIHPGYGFLSENAEFAAACAAAGIVFVGPSPEAIAAMGSKSAAKALMERAGVPLTPGYHGDRQDADHLLEQARRIGYPVLIKAVAGGGGKGMRRVDHDTDFLPALASCQREAQASFKDPRVLIERYLTGARHIEVQVFGDTHGMIVHLFERDCSIQRRHQKVIEEAPAPGMTAERRRHMGEAAVAAARAVGYVGAGTVEFIVASDGEFYFMEMNTRLQVEHPVTEMITGLDLVEWQLRVAAGEPLPSEQLAFAGHAIEARIYAEDPAREFLPSIGVLRHLRTPAPTRDVRIDTGVREGDEISPYYDPMIAKLIVRGDTRDEAIERLRESLARFEVAGVATNIEFLHRLTSAPSFVEGRVDTALIEREREHLFRPGGSPSAEVWQRAARRAVRFPERGRGPWSDQRGWRLNGARATRGIRLRQGDEEKVIEVRVDAGATVTGPEPVRIGEEIHLFENGRHFVFHVVDPYVPPAEMAEHHGGLVAPMPGRVLAVLVSAGQSVAKGTPLVVMEAMKMEHTVTAPAPGVVDEIRCAVGDQVKEGSELLVLNSPD
jgi:3-methylcrotonyl-CoA carboxylase alpha subunit